MANQVTPTSYFLRRAKRLVKKYVTLEKGLLKIEEQLLTNPKLGESYGSNIYKIRIADESKGKGKSGGFRVITYLVEENDNSIEVFLITIFDKSEEATIKKNRIQDLVNDLGI